MAAVAVVAVGVVAVAHRTGKDGPAPRRSPSVARLHLPGIDGSAAAGAVRPAPLPFAEPASGAEAVRLFLQAEADGDPDRSHTLLASGAPDRDEWVEGRTERLLPVTLEVLGERPAPGAGAGSVDVDVDVTHRPAIDPFAGFVPARTHQVWRARVEAGHWRVDAEPRAVEALLPAEAPAADVVRSWLDRLVACDPGGAAALQVDAQLGGWREVSGDPCRRAGTWHSGAVEAPRRTTDLTTFAAAYGPDVGAWARLVPVDGPARRFLAVVAPLGERWRVLGITTDLAG